MERAVHDRGGWATQAPIDRSEHELADWELLTDALVGALGQADLVNVDELRRGIESMPPEKYERASYYERWLFSVETVLTEKGVLAATVVHHHAMLGIADQQQDIVETLLQFTDRDPLHGSLQTKSPTGLARR